MGIQLQERDKYILFYIHSYRLLRSRSHILPLFGGSLHLIRRLKKLYDHKYLYRLPDRRPHEEAVYAIGNKGADLLKDTFGVPRPKVDWTQENRDLTERFVDHTLLIADIMVAIELACRERDDIQFISPEEILAKHAPPKTQEKSRKVGGRPFRWRVRFQHDGWSGRKSIEPDRMFGIGFPQWDQKPNFYFLEADRQTMPVVTRNMNRSSIVKKQLQYWASWQTNTHTKTNLYEEYFGISGIRTLFVISTGARGRKRLNNCIQVNKAVTGGGSGLFLFTKKETLLEAENILTAPLISGREDDRLLIG